MHPLIEANRTALKALGARHGVRSIKVFGSMARDDADEHSDVDLLVDAPEGVSGFALGALLVEAEELLHRHVDIVTEPALHPLIRERVLSEALPL